jgi:hypothetical protein
MFNLYHISPLRSIVRGPCADLVFNQNKWQTLWVILELVDWLLVQYPVSDGAVLGSDRLYQTGLQHVW